MPALPPRLLEVRAGPLAPRRRLVEPPAQERGLGAQGERVPRADGRAAEPGGRGARVRARLAGSGVPLRELQLAQRVVQPHGVDR